MPLEEDLGCVLFEKRGRHLIPLDSAKILYQQSVSALSDLSRAIDSTQIAAALPRKNSGWLRELTDRRLSPPSAQCL
ncbi:hypothetical protein P4S72_07440 [Vibrio sp. PP-XX7]